MEEKVRLVCFDLNKTLIQENTWYDLNLAMGMTQREDEDLIMQYTLGKITYEEGQKKLEKIYIERGRAKKDLIMQVLENYTYIEGAKELVEDLKKKGYILCILSGSMDLLVKKVALELGIEHMGYNNAFTFDETGYLQEISCIGEESIVKVRKLQQLSNTLSIPLTECACVGDGANDEALFKLTKRGITYHESNLRPFAWKTFKQLKDISFILQ